MYEENDTTVCQGSTAGAWGKVRLYRNRVRQHAHTSNNKCRQCGVVFLQEPIISLLGKINLSVISTMSLGYNLRKIGFT